MIGAGLACTVGVAVGVGGVRVGVGVRGVGVGVGGVAVTVRSRRQLIGVAASPGCGWVRTSSMSAASRHTTVDLLDRISAGRYSKRRRVVSERETCIG
jgi:hypothetical protein